MELKAAFDSKASAWEDYTHTPLGRLREELNWRYLNFHLPSHPLTALDAGCGTGGLAIRLAQRGDIVHLLDLSDQMLDLAMEKAKLNGVAAQITPYCDLVETFTPANPFDLIICHTLLEYVSDTANTIRRLAGFLKPQGLLSVVFVNRYAEPLTLALGKGKLLEALAAFETVNSAADLFGVPRQTFESAVIQQYLQSADLEIVAEYGVRIFADYLVAVDWKSDQTQYDMLLMLEMMAAQQAPFSQIGRYGQIICRNNSATPK